MKKTLLFIAGIALACGMQSCRKNEPVSPQAKEETAPLNFKQAVACPAPPVVIGVVTTGSGSSDEAGRLAIDASGTITITGYFGYTVDFDPGAGVYNLTGGASSIYIQKLNRYGNFISAQGGGNFNLDILSPVDALGNKYVSGVEDNPGGDASSDKKLTVTKYNTSGAVVWKVYAGTISSSYNYQDFYQYPSVNPAGELIVSNPNGMLYKFNAGGALQFTKTYPDNNAKVSYDSNGNFYVYGTRARLQKYSADGTLQWSIRNEATTNNPPVITALTVDNNGNIYAAGQFSETSDMDPGPGVFKVVSSGRPDIDMFVQKLNSSGQFVWALQTEARGTNESVIKPRAIKVDPTGENIVVAGGFTGTVNFKMNGMAIATSKTYYANDAFILGIKQCK